MKDIVIETGKETIVAKIEVPVPKKEDEAIMSMRIRQEAIMSRDVRTMFRR